MNPCRKDSFNDLIFQEAGKIAEVAHCVALMIFGDTMVEWKDLNLSFEKGKIVLVTRKSVDFSEKDHFDYLIEVASITSQRFSQRRSAIVIGTTRGIFSIHERICCVAGLTGSNTFDTIALVDVRDEMESMALLKGKSLPSEVQPSVLANVLSVASEIAVEGREGRATGCLFILGDSEQIRPYTCPLILNPFHGHAEKQRNILDPFVVETVKEFSSLDGAFIIRSDGIIEAAGMMIQTPKVCHISLPLGLGTRHAAAAAISSLIPCVAIAVSQSTRRVTCFYRGEMLSILG
ncbi:MAG: DNA integrity scanning protein DisA nucleotide-binding domain protein [Puniceicoccales bacterium]|jgi:DNA integrity scanning protein DisA with diadenylate cyclase activity|nr:DNA integrity scanning protein DisA nucleotide-binding domain protein [Puniceicoccales bacterium]